MFKVTLSQPAIVSAENLAALVSIVGVPVIMEPADGAAATAAAAPVAAKRGRKPGVKAAPKERPLDANGNPIKRKYTKRGTAVAAAPEGGGAPETQAADPAPETQAAQEPSSDKGESGKKTAGKKQAGKKPESGEAVDPANLLERFSNMADKEYEKALQLLENFGVQSFSAIKETEHAAFSDKMKELGF